MPAPDLSSYKVAASEVSSATKFNNLVQAVQDEFGDIDADQIPGFPSSAEYFLRGDAAWTKLACARVFHNVAQAIANGTPTVLAFNSERFDNDAIHDNATNNSRLTCKTAGRYLITATVSWAASGAGNFRACTLLLNGVTVIASLVHGPTPGGAVATDQTVSTVYELALNDYVEVRVNQDSGAALNVTFVANYSPEFSMVRVA